MGDFSGRLAAWLLTALLFQLSFCAGEDTCQTVAQVAENTGCTDVLYPSRTGEAFGIPQDIAKLIHSSETERKYTWIIPADDVAGAGTSSEDALASAVPDNVMFKQIIAIPGSVPVPQPGKKMETQTVSGSTLWLSADHSGRVTVVSPDSSNVAILKPTLLENYKESMQTAVNLQSCVGLVHIVAEVRKASEGGIDVLDSHIATKARPSWLPAAVDKSQWTSLHVGRARRLLSHALQQEGAPSVIVGVRSLLQAVDPSRIPGPNPVTPEFPDPESPPTPSAEDAAKATAPEKVNPDDGDGAVAVGPAVSSTLNADAPAAAVPNAAPPMAAGTTAPEATEATENSTLPEERASSGRGNNTIIIVIVVACAALLLAALVVCAAILRRRKKNSERGGPSKSLSMGNRGVMYQQDSHFGGSYTNSTALRHAQAPVPMAMPPSPHRSKAEMEMQADVGHHPDAQYGAPMAHSAAPYNPAAHAMPNQHISNGKISEPRPGMHGPLGVVAVGNVQAAPVADIAKRRNEGGNPGTTLQVVSATAPIAGKHADKDMKKKRTPDSQKRALQHKTSSKRGKPVLAAQPLPIMSAVPVSPQTQTELANLEQKLASFGPHAVLGDRYRLINNVCCARESSVVVNAQGVRDNLKYTITFFLNKDQYNVEHGLYSTEPLKGLVPRAHMYDDSNPLKAPDGSALPRAIVLERGETVAEWVARRKPDANVKAEVLRNIALRVRALHEAGYVHCNLSPEAVKWYPRENRWMLCEFGHAARAGDARRGGGGISDTKITYAAPEGVAVDGRTESLTLRSDVVAKVPLDVWSFAVVALEVMFGSQLLDSTNEAEVKAQLGNVTPLPWEDERMYGMLIETIGEPFTSVLFEALQRPAADRPSMSALHDKWRIAQRNMRNDQDQSVSDLL